MAIKFSTYAQLKTALDQEAQGVATVAMWQLRDAHGAERLGVNVIQNISEELDSRGIAHYPQRLEGNQWAPARVYLKNSPVGRVIRAVLALDEKQDEVLRKLTNEKADDVLKRVRELVCD